MIDFFNTLYKQGPYVSTPYGPKELEIIIFDGISPYNVVFYAACSNNQPQFLWNNF